MPVSPINQVAFDRALATPTYSSQDDRWRVYVDRDLQSVFEDDDVLGPVAMVPRFADLMRLKFPRSKWSPAGTCAHHWQGVGNLLHWAMRYELATQEEGPDGSPVWRRARKEPSFIVDPNRGWRVLQVRGLPPALQSEQDRKEAARRKLRGTLDRKAREAADPEIRRIVAAMQDLDRDILVEGEAIKRRLPEICHGRRLAEVSPVVIETHHRLGMDRDELKRWVRALSTELVVLQHRYSQPNFRWGLGTPIPAELPPEDEDALAALL